MKLKHLATTLLAAVLCAPVAALEFDPGLIVVSGGSWIATPVNRDPIYYNKLSVTAYMAIEGFKVVPSLPVGWTYESSRNKQRFFLSDGSLMIGRRFGEFEPRAGVIIPLGYGNFTNWQQEAWIGTNNVKAQVGLAYGRADDAVTGIPFAFEVTLSAPVTEKNAYLRRGSVSALAFGKTYWQINEDLRWGAEILILASRSIWSWIYEARPGVWEQIVESSAGIVPNIWIEHHLTGSLYCSIKAGVGPHFKYTNQSPSITHSSNSLNMSLGVQWYP